MHLFAPGIINLEWPTNFAFNLLLEQLLLDLVLLCDKNCVSLVGLSGRIILGKAFGPFLFKKFLHEWYKIILFQANAKCHSTSELT